MNSFIIPLSQEAMYSFLGGALLIVVIGIAVLVHHWGYYGIKGNKKVGIKTVFFVGIILLFFIAMTLISLYTTLK